MNNKKYENNLESGRATRDIQRFACFDEETDEFLIYDP